MRADDRHGRIVLVVEDNPLDQELIERGLDARNSALYLAKVDDGEAALEYLVRAADCEVIMGRAAPSLVLLDLNLPNLDGREVLARLREDERFTTLPIVVLSTSGSEEDIRSSYTLGCNSYIQKPDDPNAFMDAIRAVRDYWLGIVSLPPAA